MSDSPADLPACPDCPGHHRHLVPDVVILKALARQFQQRQGLANASLCSLYHTVSLDCKVRPRGFRDSLPRQSISLCKMARIAWSDHTVSNEDATNPFISHTFSHHNPRWAYKVDPACLVVGYVIEIGRKQDLNGAFTWKVCWYGSNSNYAMYWTHAPYVLSKGTCSFGMVVDISEESV